MASMSYGKRLRVSQEPEQTASVFHGVHCDFTSTMARWTTRIRKASSEGNEKSCHVKLTAK
ncbi:hypothetical protein M378DRAFT_167753 [Amanita muscaria Koide BX008]|uniref:Uncharacterized protein n=1 Tax=Amanita muscaria (strain Koide BX008) TaxID=946122 RepID=A0A0C2SCT4_AMAMK|nr:hypothetical protein M378DRAFT_167753 [Amanita muscaria Koide BX008]